MKQLILPFEHLPTFEAKDFILSKSNEEAYRWVKEWPQWPSPSVAIYGESGCGKTHLSSIWRSLSNACYLRAEDFDALSLERLFEEPGVFILDEGHLIKREEKLFHFYNHLRAIHGNLLLLSLEAPARWNVALPDLRSRLNAIPAINILPPDEALLAQVMQKLFNDLQVKVDEAVIQFLLKHMERSFDNARLWAAALNTCALTQKRDITIPLVREILNAPEGVEKYR